MQNTTVFTGIVQASCQVADSKSGRLKINRPSDWALDVLQIGESIAVNGVCLTLVQAAETLEFGVSEETLAVTSLYSLKSSSIVNLERALRPHDRLGGHFVQGHVDQVGTFLRAEKLEDSHIITLDAGPDSPKYLTPKGSITVDGISLTIINPHDTIFQVAVIPHTWENTNLHQRQPGDAVNIEFDMLAKYMETLLAHRG